MPQALVRFGAIPEVVPCDVSDEAPLGRGTWVVLETHRGKMLGEVLELQRRAASAQGGEALFRIVGVATPEDQADHSRQSDLARAEFVDWEARIAEWGLDLQLIDVERTLDGSKTVLYVLNDRGADCTQLALQAAIAGLGLIDVQPVSLDGLAPIPAAGGTCGSGGGGSCGCST